ncbi:hypothetical protein [Streptomyces sp. NPDC057877]
MRLDGFAVLGVRAAVALVSGYRRSPLAALVKARQQAKEAAAV